MMEMEPYYSQVGYFSQTRQKPSHIVLWSYSHGTEWIDGKGGRYYTYERLWNWYR